MSSVRSSRRWLLAAPLAVLTVVASAGLLRARFDPVAPGAGAADAGGSGAGASPPAPPPSREPRVSVGLAGQAGPVPARGSGLFAYAPGRGPVLGGKGSLRRFQVAVERGSNEDVVTFAAQVDGILGDRRSWIGDGRVRFQRVGPADAHAFRILLATRETAGRLCSAGGMNIVYGAHPYTSCRLPGRVVINLDRWRFSAASYRAAKVPLATYRHYLINHEVGHELGRGHEGCPRRRGPAPVMVQQTLSLRGCLPYAWPRRADRPLSGPGV